MWLLPALRCTGRKRSTLTYRDPLHPQSRRMGSFFSSDAPQPEIINTVKDTISENCVVIFSKTACPYCTMAKDAFRDLDVSYKVVELDQVEHGGQIQTILHKMTGARTKRHEQRHGGKPDKPTVSTRFQSDGDATDFLKAAVT
uniref:Glutaredoxin 2 n=1 Tax=Leptobrachium leishanense TaxID=445787 RepID=A0A8C5QYV0_9ANUR